LRRNKIGTPGTGSRGKLEGLVCTNGIDYFPEEFLPEKERFGQGQLASLKVNFNMPTGHQSEANLEEQVFQLQAFNT